MSDVTKGIIPFGAIPDSNTFPDNTYRLKVEKLEPVLTKEKEGKNQKLMFKLDCVIVEPAEYKGQHYFEQFCIGNEDDPDAEELKTWQTTFGAKEFKKFIKALGIPFGDEEDRESFCNAVRGGEFLVSMIEQTEPKTKKIDGIEQDNPYAGKVRNKVTAYWKLGEKEAGTAKPVAKKAGAGTVKDAKPAPSDEVTCTACRKRVPRKTLKEHVEGHMKELAAAGVAEDE